MDDLWVAPRLRKPPHQSISQQAPPPETACDSEHYVVGYLAQRFQKVG